LQELIDMEEELFNLEVNEEGIHWLRKLRSLALVILAGTILVEGFILYTTIPYVIKSINEPTLPSEFRLSNTVFVFYSIIHFALQITQVIFYYRFVTSGNKAIEEYNSVMLNKSFKWLYLQALNYVVMLSIALIYFLHHYFTTRTY
jgi:hypothetical protein